MDHNDYPVLKSLEYRYDKDNIVKDPLWYSNDVIESTVEITIPKGYKLHVQFIPIHDEN